MTARDSGRLVAPDGIGRARPEKSEEIEREKVVREQYASHELDHEFLDVNS